MYLCLNLGSPGRQSPVLNLSKSGADQGSSNCGASDRSEAHSPPPSVRDEENLSEDNISDTEDHLEKDEGTKYSVLKIRISIFN